MIDVVNIIASGNIGQELDLESLYSDIAFPQKEYNPDTTPTLQLRSEQDGPVIILYTSGAYNVMGARHEREINELYSTLISSLDHLGIQSGDRTSPEVRNLVCKANLNREVDLSTLTVALGIEKVEYEPEQSPFVYYWPNNFDCLITIPTNGQVVITGVITRQAAKQALMHLQDRIASVLPE